jgi:hypothetical protein
VEARRENTKWKGNVIIAWLDVLKFRKDTLLVSQDELLMHTKYTGTQDELLTKYRRTG